MTDRVVTPESRYLGRVLEQVMQDSGLSRVGLAGQLGWSPGEISRLISGQRGGIARHLVAWLDACGVRGDRREEILRLRLPCGSCGCRCDHTGLLACCKATESRGPHEVIGISNGWSERNHRPLIPNAGIGELETIERTDAHANGTHDNPDRT